MSSISSAVIRWNIVNWLLGLRFFAACNASESARGFGKNRSANNSALLLWLVCVVGLFSLRRSGGIGTLSDGAQLLNLAQRSSFHKSFCLCAVAAIARLQLLDFTFSTFFVAEFIACL
jgi:hypothetical protein